MRTPWNYAHIIPDEEKYHFSSVVLILSWLLAPYWRPRKAVNPYFSKIRGRWNLNAIFLYFTTSKILLLYTKLMVCVYRTSKFLNFLDILCISGVIDVNMLKSKPRWKSTNLVNFMDIWLQCQFKASFMRKKYWEWDIKWSRLIKLIL